MITIIIVCCVIMAILSLLYANTCNGKGPEAGCAGVFAFVIAVVFIGLAILALVFQLGRMY